MKKQNSIYTLLIALLCFVSSCDYLGVSDQLAGGLQNTEQVFDNVSYTKRWYANVFAGIPDYSGINSVNVGAFKNPWTGMCRLKNIEFGYQLPKKFMDKIGFEAARIYIMGYNLAVWDDIKYFDPEAGNANAGLNYPLPRTFTLGLDFTF